MAWRNVEQRNNQQNSSSVSIGNIISMAASASKCGSVSNSSMAKNKRYHVACKWQRIRVTLSVAAASQRKQRRSIKTAA